MIYIVSTLDIVDGYPSFITPVGLYDKDSDAIDVVVQNQYHISEDNRPYALIEGYEFGTYPDCVKIAWYKWDRDSEAYRQCEEPESQKYFSNYAIH